MKEFETMTVKELREESRQRGLTLEYKGHKFTKAELIERIKEHDEQSEKECDDVKTCADCKNFPCEKTPEVKMEVEQVQEVKETEQKQDGQDYIRFAKTMEEIEKKYQHRKKDEVYENELKVGSFVVFFHYVEAANHNIYKKLRTGKVVAVNRKRELVKIETILGTELQLGYEDLLYIKGADRNCSYPKDITLYLRNQRTEKGRELINERFAGESVGTN